MKKSKIKGRIHERPTLGELLSRFADIPADLTGGMTLEMRGRNEMLLCGCREILEYSDIRIRILQGRCSVCILGRRLTMSSFSDGRITVGGEIDAIDFCGGDCFEEQGEKGKEEK